MRRKASCVAVLAAVPTTPLAMAFAVLCASGSATMRDTTGTHTAGERWRRWEKAVLRSDRDEREGQSP